MNEVIKKAIDYTLSTYKDHIVMRVGCIKEGWI